MTTEELLDEEGIEKWDRLQNYIWSEINKEWPFICSDDIFDLFFYVREEKNVSVLPEEIGSEKLKNLINAYLDNHSLSVNDLTDKYIEMENEKNKFSKVGFDIFIDWSIGRGTISFDMEENRYFKENFKSCVEILEKEFEFQSPATQIIAIFSGSNTPRSTLEYVRGIVDSRFEVFAQKWDNVLKKEANFINELMKKVVNSQLFDENQQLKID